MTESADAYSVIDCSSFEYISVCGTTGSFGDSVFCFLRSHYSLSEMTVLLFLPAVLGLLFLHTLISTFYLFEKIIAILTNVR